MSTRKIGCLFVLGTIAACLLVFFGTRAVKQQMFDGGGAVNVADAVRESAADGQQLRTAILTYKARHGAYPTSLVPVIQDGLINGKTLHAALDDDPNPLHVSWIYTPPPTGAGPSFVLLTLPYQVRGAQQTLHITLGGTAQAQREARFCATSRFPIERFRVTDVGTLGGVYTQALAMNNGGVAVGQADEGGAGVGVAVAWDGKTLRRLSTPKGAQSAALSVNVSGLVAGWTETGGDGDKQPCVWTNNEACLLPTGGTQGGGAACAINDAGQVAGYVSETAGSPAQACVWRENVLQRLGTLGGAASYALAENNAGVVVGQSETGAGREARAFVFQSQMRGLPTLGGPQASAAAVNDGGAIVGFSTLNGDKLRHAVLWKNGRIVDLGTLGGRDSAATGINARGEIVGWSDVAGGARPHACVWTNRRPHDLNADLPAAADWLLLQAFGVSQNGVVCGYGLHAGVVRGFMGVREPLPPSAP